MEIEINQTVEVKTLMADMGVRYWEDGEVNGVQDSDDAPQMPFASGENWRIEIDLDTGKILNWPAGTVAKTHYKVCDAGIYRLLDANKKQVAVKDGYVPAMLCPGGDGYGDYVIMEIGADGQILNWEADLDYFDGG